MPVPGTRALLFPSFVLIAVLFASANGLALYRGSALRRQTRELVGGMVNAVELVTRVSRDIDRERHLAEAHVVATAPADMLRLEAQIAAVRADLEVASRAYDQLGPADGERVLWWKLHADAKALEQPIDEALRVSRENQDTDARALLTALESRFDAVDADVSALIRKNRQNVEGTASHVESVQRSARLFFGGLAGLGVTLSLLVGAAATRLIRKRERQLERYSLLLEQRNRDLDAFAGRVAHDLRGPLSTISIAAHRLRESPPGAMLDRGVRRMNALIEDLLALSRIDSSAQAARCDPSQVAAQLREELQPQLAEADASLTVEVAPARIRCVEGLLHQALWNLLENAVKYRRDGVHAEIAVEGHLNGAGYELQVRDNGVGMSADEAARVFEPFFRASATRDRPGTGLGLSIVKRVVETAGGSVRVASQPGAGTTFVLRLPPDQPPT
jgi:signal transduction histidine kinase